LRRTAHFTAIIFVTHGRRRQQIGAYDRLASLVRRLLLDPSESTHMRRSELPHLTDDDIRYQLHVMLRWCSRFGKSDRDWVELAAERFRRKHPVTRPPSISAQEAQAA
jgi:hypothetical protein